MGPNMYISKKKTPLFGVGISLNKWKDVYLFLKEIATILI